MADFTTVFAIDHWSNGLLADTLFRLAIGVAVLLGGLISAIRMWRKPQARSWGNALFCVLTTVWGVFWIVMHDFPMMFQRIDGLVTAYKTNRCEVSEGVVSVLREQPVHGHSSGDHIVVAGREFVVNYFYATPAYRNTIAHGGVLRSGAYVRLCHVDGAIVRLDLRNSSSERK